MMETSRLLAVFFFQEILRTWEVEQTAPSTEFPVVPLDKIAYCFGLLGCWGVIQLFGKHERPTSCSTFCTAQTVGMNEYLGMFCSKVDTRCSLEIILQHHHRIQKLCRNHIN